MENVVAGIFQKILHVDLSKGLIGEEKLPLTWYKEFIGGIGVGFQYLFEDLKLKNPILKDPVIIMTGPLTGTPIPATSKAFIISFLQEQLELHLSSIEGKFPSYLKLAGFDGLVLTGRSEKPVALEITHKESKLVNADQLWGLDVKTTAERIKKSDQDLSSIMIGPQGENLNPFATVIADQYINAGRGIGNHIGIKKLKAISVKADWELKIGSEMSDFYAELSDYTDKFFKKKLSTQNRRSCFGCSVCCGLIDTDQNFIMMEDDLNQLEILLPGLSPSLVRGFYKDCLKNGVDVFATAELLPDQDFATITDRTIADIFTKEQVANEQMNNVHLWEDALYATNQEYSDLILNNFRSCNGLVQRENIAMAKNCLPVCHRWDMSLDAMVQFLNKITGLDFGNNDLITVGDKMIDMTMGFFKAIDYSPINIGSEQNEPGLLPMQMCDKIEDYIKIRNWDETGYPSQSRMKALGVPNLH